MLNVCEMTGFYKITHYLIPIFFSYPHLEEWDGQKRIILRLYFTHLKHLLYKFCCDDDAALKMFLKNLF